MAERRTGFAYRNIELYKSESLGSGSYGGVCKAKCDGLLCAAKIMHPTLFDLRDPGTASYLRKFREECHLLSLDRHPNVVQYLATYYDPDTQLPVLLMELCDESLTAFLERSPGPLSYHIQLNICHNIALALVYLHSNGLIHRDLTGNNVLMIAGTRAKITDFGMSKLATVNPRMTALTLCPGNVLYMSPEALDEAKSYTAKLDVFSFGVLIIQILTRQFPNPTDRFRTVRENQNDDGGEEDEDVEENEEVRVVVPETERRQAHLRLIPDTHSLKPLALQCLKKKERQRPSALQLSERLSELKQAPQYTESVCQAQSSRGNRGGEETEALRREAQELRQQNTDKEEQLQQQVAQIQQLEQQLRGQRILTEAKTREASEHLAHNTQLQNMVEEYQHTIVINNRELEEKQQTIEAKERQIQEYQHTMATKEEGLQKMQEQLRASEQLVSEFQQSLQQKDKTITDLQQTISSHERKNRQLQQQDMASSVRPQQLPVSADMPQTTMAAAAVVAQKDISKMTWREGKNAPEKMQRGSAVVHGNTAYFRPADSNKVYSYWNILGKVQWSQLPDNPNSGFSLAVIDGLLTSVGGYNSRYDVISTLLSLIGEGERRQWSEVFPPMLTARSSTVCITTGQALVVAGGHGNGYLDTVEVMNINTKYWTTVYPLPQRVSGLTGITCGDTIYLTGGYILQHPSKTVFTCSLPDLWQPETRGSRIRHALFGSDKTKSSVWKEISSLPVTGSTLATLGGHLLAIGGWGYSRTWSRTADVYRYNSQTDSWHVTSQMKNKRSHCFAVTLPEDRLIVVGGRVEGYLTTDSVEMLEEK